MSSKPITLSPKERRLKEKIKNTLDLFWKPSGEFSPPENGIERIAQNAKLCLELHRILKANGHPPVHSKYMLANRRVATSESIEFYNHIHPQQDLIAFIDDPLANVRNTNKPDVTMGKTFCFNVYSRRWGHDDRYQIRRIAEGWYIEHIGINGECDHEGNPYLYDNFRQDYISYPADICHYMSSIWTRADEGASFDEIQEMLDKIAKWISDTEKSSPDNILI